MWHMPIMLEHEKLRQKDCEFKDSLDLVCLCIYVHIYIESENTHSNTIYIQLYLNQE